MARVVAALAQDADGVYFRAARRQHPVHLVVHRHAISRRKGGRAVGPDVTGGGEPGPGNQSAAKNLTVPLCDPTAPDQGKTDHRDSSLKATHDIGKNPPRETSRPGG